MRPTSQLVPLLACAAFFFAANALAQSTCYGRVDNGRVEDAVSLPREGKNFVRMAQGPVTAGRVFVHSLVHDIVIDAYAALAAKRPGTRWVYGETGLHDHIHVNFAVQCK